MYKKPQEANRHFPPKAIFGISADVPLIFGYSADVPMI
jgi:hypothetical protein